MVTAASDCPKCVKTEALLWEVRKQVERAHGGAGPMAALLSRGEATVLLGVLDGVLETVRATTKRGEHGGKKHG
jgi:hypothetical protein